MGSEDFKKAAYEAAKKYALGNPMSETACQLMADWAYKWCLHGDNNPAFKMYRDCFKKNQQLTKENERLKGELNDCAKRCGEILIKADALAEALEHCAKIDVWSASTARPALTRYKKFRGE